jgi:hypothetical protein
MSVSWKESMIRSVAVGLCIGAGLSSAQAGPLNKQWVDGEAKWVVHMDVEAAMASSYGPRLQQLYQVAIEGLGDGEPREVLRRAGIDLMRDVKGATLYGMDSRGEEGVLVVHAAAGVDRLLEPLSEHLPGFERVADAAPMTFSWMEGKSRRYGRIQPGPAEGERLIILARSIEEFRRNQTVLGDAAASMQGAIEEPMARNPARGSMLFVMARGLNEDGKGAARGQAAMLSRLTSTLVFDMGESGMQSWAEVSLAARKEREADAMIQMMNGMIAMAQVTAHTEPEYERYAAMLDAVSIGKAGQIVTARMNAPSSLMLELMSELQSLPLECDVPAEGGQGSGAGEAGQASELKR